MMMIMIMMTKMTHRFRHKISNNYGLE
jgi:hypothetical protein